MVEQAFYMIREFREEDLQSVIKINLECLPEHYPSYFYIEIHRNYPKAFLVAENERGEIVGYVMCRVERNFASLFFGRGEKKGHVISIAVLPEYRRRGIGRGLMIKAINALKNYYNCDSCYLEVRVSNTAAINLYKKLGFEIVRRIIGYYRDGEDAYLMERKLR